MYSRCVCCVCVWKFSRSWLKSADKGGIIYLHYRRAVSRACVYIYQKFEYFAVRLVVIYHYYYNSEIVSRKHDNFVWRIERKFWTRGIHAAINAVMEYPRLVRAIAWTRLRFCFVREKFRISLHRPFSIPRPKAFDHFFPIRGPVPLWRQ